MSSWTVFSAHSYGPGDTYTGAEATASEAAIALAATQGNTHATASPIDHPDGSVTAAKLAAGAATDTVIGNRTPDETVTAVSGAGNLSKCLNMLANIIKQITGATHWYTAPSHTLNNVDVRLATVEAAYIVIASAGGGAAGTKIWVGTTDPGGSASEGDIWIKA